MKKSIAFILAIIPAILLAVTDEEIMSLYKQRVIAEYNRDMKSDSGREKWYGKIEKSIILTNELRRIDIHSSGAVFTNNGVNAYKIRATEYQKKTQIPPSMTNGVPKKLAEARARRWREKNTVSNVTIKVTGNAKK